MRSSLISIPFLLALAAPARADSVDDIVAKHLAARGGDKLRALKSLRLTGHMVFGNGDSSVETQWGELVARPGQIRDEFTVQGLTQIAAYDGREGWNVQPFSGRRDPERASVDDSKTLAQHADFDGPLVDYRAKGNRVEYLGTEDVDGTAAIKLRVTRKDGDLAYVYLDPDSYLEIRETSVHRARGAEDVTETDFGSYEQVAGVWIAFSIEAGAKGQPRGLHFTIDRAEPNVALDPALFRLPTGPVGRVAVAGPAAAHAPEAVSPPAPMTPVVFDAGTIAGLGARNIGSAAMSGRIAAVAGVNEAGKTTLYVGAASGGVWRSFDGGTTFKPVFDKEAVQSIGAITIDPSNPKTIWVGTGEAWTRNSASLGDGIYRSTDGGETWTNMGLRESERISRIVVHPHNSNIVFACAPGKLWSDSRDRGLYRTADGGRTWQLVLAGANPSTGCSSVTMDPKNPDVMLAGMWDFRRKGWTFRSGGEGPDSPSGSGMFRSTDGGRTWTSIAREKGLPAGPWGRVEVVYAPSDARVVYALVESKDSALYRSDDGGATWDARDKSSKMVWRPFYFARLVVDPANPNRVFKPDLGLIVSEDGGRSFADTGGGSHGDWHDVWIDPQNPKRVVGGDDGGLWLSQDGGNRWLHAMNLPVSQFYHVSVDDQDPYQVYGGLQDNSSWVGDSAFSGGLTNSRWQNLCNSDGFWTIVDPTDAHAVYCEGQGGYITRVDRRTMAARDIQPKAGYHEKLRFNWNTPIYASPTHKGTIYIGSQFLFRSRDRGDTWERISPDLSTNDPEKQKQELSGGITVDNSSAEMHTTIYSISESPKNPALIWAGTDDGNVQLTRDGGHSWTNLVKNVPDLPPASWVSWIEASRFDPATAYAAFDRHTFGDMTPWVYVTKDYGKTWKRLVGPEMGVRGYVHVIKEDTVKPNLLFLGTELGLWISPDAGAHWARFTGGNFPAVAVREVQVQPRDNDLVLATHGRGIWIIDDLTPLRALSDAVLAKPVAFLPARPAQQRMQGGGGWVEGDATFVGDNPPNGLVVTYYLRARHVYGPIELEVLDAAGKVIDTLTPSKHRGINRVVWSMRVKPPRVPRAAQIAGGSTQGPRVVPGTYTLRLVRGKDVVDQKVTIGLDRRAPYTVADRKAQFDAVMHAREVFDHMSDVVDKIEATREALEEKLRRLPASDPLGGKVRGALARLGEIKTKIVATKEGGAITGEERIREHLDYVYGAINGWEGRPGKYQIERVAVLARELGDASKELDAFIAKDAHAYDNELKRRGIDPIPGIADMEERYERDHAGKLDDDEVKCIASKGRDCKSEVEAAERD
ncbi:MAG TPA: hypothetical protein VGF94_13325 [Kofleriaceae bacterium]|jgi:photosystem II stability/assembly factor-like uncharacterized protein